VGRFLATPVKTEHMMNINWLHFRPVLEVHFAAYVKITISGTREEKRRLKHSNPVNFIRVVQVVCNTLDVLGGQAPVVVEGEEHGPAM